MSLLKRKTILSFDLNKIVDKVVSTLLLLSIEESGGKSKWAEERLEEAVDWPDTSIHNKVQRIHSCVARAHSCVADSMSHLHGRTAERVSKLHGGVANLHSGISNAVA